jgi:phosphoribosylamine-glycine ligase
MPKPLRYVNEKLSELFEELSYRGFWSSEVRVDLDGVPYLIDPCCRMASPPGELYLYLIENLAEVIWAGADGELVEPEFLYPYAAQLVLKSDWAQYGWQPIEFPEELRDHIKIHYLTIKNGRCYFVPQQIPIPEIGAVVAGGDTQEEAIEKCIEIAEQVRGYDVKFEASALEKAAEDLARVA